MACLVTVHLDVARQAKCHGNYSLRKYAKAVSVAPAAENDLNQR